MKQINKIKQDIINKGIPIDESIKIKLQLLQDTINEYYLLKDDLKEHGIVITFNNNKTRGLNPSYKAKILAEKLILKLLEEIGFEKPNDDDYDDAEEFINKLIS